MEVCVGLIALTQIAFLVVAVRVAMRLTKAVNNTSRVLDLIEAVTKDAARTASEVRSDVRRVTNGLEEVTQRMKSVAARFERVGEKAASISTLVLDEVEGPVRTAAAVIRGVRKGVAVVFDRITRRLLMDGTRKLGEGAQHGFEGVKDQVKSRLEDMKGHVAEGVTAAKQEMRAASNRIG